MSTPETNPNHPWVKKVDKKTQRTYYRNTELKKSSWVKPEGWKDEEGTDAAAAATPTKAAAPTPAAAADTKTDSAADPAAAASGGDPNEDPANWVEKKAKDGRVYFVNSKTQKRQWKKPACMGGPAAATPTKKKATLKGAAKSVATAGKATGKDKTPVNTDNVNDPANWRQAEHKGKTYWYNRATKERTWKNPFAKQKEEKKKEEKKEESSSSDDEEDFEQGFSSDMKAHMAMRRQQTSAMLMHHAEPEPEGTVEEYKYQFAKHRHGFWNRIMRTGGVADSQTLLTFKDSLIKKALLKQNRHLDKEAVQAFKNVMSYMGDRVSGKDEIQHARKILRNLMQAPSGLRDEIYLQLIKQTTQNPRENSLIKGWELMNYCLVTFPPSKSLKKFLSNYIEKSKEEKVAEVVAIATRCEQTLPRITLMGQRKQVPSGRELVAVGEGKPVTLTIHLLEDGVSKTVNVDSFTLVRDVEDQMAEKCNLLTTSPFALYEALSAKENVESILNRRDRILDVLGAWENDPLEELDRSDDKSFKKQSAKKKDIKREPYDKLLYKAKLVLKTRCKEIIRDPEAINLIYQQATHDIVTARYPEGRWGSTDTESEIIRVAALQMQARWGDYDAVKHSTEWIFSELGNYLPGGKTFKKMNAEAKNVCQKIADNYQEVAGLSTLEAKVLYLDNVQDWIYYGITFFSVGQRCYPDSPSPLFIGINCEGVMVVHPQKKTKIASWGYNEVVHWGHAAEKFVIVVGNAIQQLKLILKTRRGDQMSNLIHSYIKFELKQAEAEL